MKVFTSLRTFLAFVFHRSQAEREMEDELRSHLESRADELERQGLSRAEAERQARIEFGGYERYKEECREALGSRLLGEFVADTRYGLRQLRRSPGFTAVAVLTLTLGIGANTAVFSVVSAVLLRRLPYSDPDRLVWITEYWPRLNNTIVPSPDFLNWRDQNQVFGSVAAYGGFGELNLSGSGEPERIDGIGVTWNFFPMLGVRPALGRGFLPEEDWPAGPPVVILSHSLWQRRFHSDPSLVGKTITLDETGYTVIGIMPDGFRFPGDWSPELFAPSGLPLKADWSARELAIVGVIARLKPQVSLERATADVVTINQRSDKAVPPLPTFAQMRVGLQVRMVTLHQHLAGDSRLVLLILLGAVGFVLLLACANVANLQLARVSAREKEFAVRAALGAGRWRLARQLLVESFALAALGGVAGLVLGAGGVGLFRQLGPPNIPGLKTAGFDPWVFAFIAAITAFTGAVFGLAPVFVASRLHLEETLKEARPSAPPGRSAQRVRGLLMVSEVALALVLLIGAGLLIRSLVRLTSVDPGFDPRHVLTERIMLPLGKYSKPAQQATFFQDVLARVEKLPGVESAAAASSPPLTDFMSRASVELEGRLMPPGTAPSTPVCVITPSYFHALHVPLISGRYFTPYDADSAPRVAIVNEPFARRFFGDADPLGRRIRLGGPEGNWYSIVGVVQGVRHLPLGTDPPAEVFSSYLQDPSFHMTLVVRAIVDPGALAGSVRAKVWEVDKNQPVYDVATMEHRFSEAVAPQRFNALVLGIFAGMAVVLAGVGVYGVMAYSVARRTHEIGIRMALGAKRQDVIRLLLRGGAALALVGTTLGLAGALALTRFLSNLLYGVTARDPLTFVAVALILIGVALIASYIPARRATKVDPMVALRHE
jgi:putative ABC transport system permease protein